ncbi:MAG: TIGR04348 family glycosyltransferase [Gammaproteobacteria bacterium]|nr:TIGR04348 family glycosyltransferase [Gammaproteobacteria bacterium]
MPLNISLITPAEKRALNGNSVTANRWARILTGLGHRVSVANSNDGQWHWNNCDLLVAIHAFRSARAIEAFRSRYPGRALIVLLAGTDIYRFQFSAPHIVRRSLHAASKLVALHDQTGDDLPPEAGPKLRIIRQSALPLPQPLSPSKKTFDVCIAGHLREEKDPLRTALAARLAPSSSKLRVVHLGKAHTRQWAAAARTEMQTNPRYIWRGEVRRWQVRRQFARAHAMVISSVMEGGANVVSEAIVAGLPIIASDISGNQGMLGPAHPGYFATGDETSLAEVLVRAERDRVFLESVRATSLAKAPLYHPDRERAAWSALLEEL